VTEKTDGSVCAGSDRVTLKKEIKRLLRAVKSNFVEMKYLFLDLFAAVIERRFDVQYSGVIMFTIVFAIFRFNSLNKIALNSFRFRYETVLRLLKVDLFW